jgi:predicted amidohydrolase
MKVRIAVVQPRIKAGDEASNLRNAKKVLLGIRGKADIVLFPEQFLTGPVGKKTGTLKSEKEYIDDLAPLAKAAKTDIAFGLIVNGNGTALNRAYYIDRNGKVLGRYTKSNLWHSETDQVKKGKSINVFRTRFGMVSLVICWDIMDDVLFRRIAKRKAEIILCPALWWKGSSSPGIKRDREFSRKFVDAMCLSKAYGNNAVIAFSNAAGILRFDGFSDASIGNSQVAVPFAGYVARINGSRQGVAIASVDMGILKEAAGYFG